MSCFAISSIDDKSINNKTIMSKIRVWTSEGEWSEEVVGLDKINLLKRALLYAWPTEDEYDDDGQFLLENYSFNDNRSLILEPYDENFELDYPWRHIKDSNNKIVLLKDIDSFQLPLYVLKQLRDDPKYSYLYAVYDSLIKAAKIPSGIKVSCLRLLFEDE